MADQPVRPPVTNSHAVPPMHDTVHDQVRPVPGPAPAATHMMSPADSAPNDPTPTQQFAFEPPLELVQHPRYEIIELLGQGGMGAVYKARDKVMHRTVAIKVIGGGGPQDPTLTERFRREVTVLANLAHPNIVVAHDAVFAGRSNFLVMEYVEGATLGEILQSGGRLPIADACELIRQACLGMQHVHERKLVHRDIKPANLLLTPEGQVKILDLGLARLQPSAEAEAQLTGPHRPLTTQTHLLGTLDFMAPEQWDANGKVDIRADIYALGCTLYTLLAGQAPFEHFGADTVVQKMNAHLMQAPPPMHRFRPEVPDELVRLLHRALAKDPKDRFQEPRDLAEALTPFCKNCDLQRLLKASRERRVRLLQPGPPPTEPEAHRPNRRRFLRQAVLGGSGLGIVGVGTGAWWWFNNGAGAERGTMPSVPASAAPIKVGVLHSLSGTMAISETPVVDATLLAIDEVNSRGGVLGRPIEPVVVDGESNWGRFAAEAERLITQERVAAVFGCWTSASRKTVRPIFEKHKHLLFYPVQYEGLEQSPNIVYTGAAPNQQLLPAVPWSLGNLGSRFFLVGSDYVFPRMAHLILCDEIKARKGTCAGEAFVPLGGTLFEPIIQQIAAAKPDVILNTINGDSNVAFFRALRAAGFTSAKLPTISFSLGEEELRRLGLSDMVGDYAVWNYFQSIESPENAAFINRFQARYGRQRVLTDPMEAAYVGVHLWANAVEKAGTSDTHAVRQALRGLHFAAPEGPVHIDAENQHLWKIVRIGRITPRGQFDIVYRSEKAVRPIPYPASRPPAEWDRLLDELHQRWGGQWANPAGPT